MSFRYIDRYKIVTELGRGGMATVYLAEDPRGGQDVAVKVLRREFLTDLGLRARFEREAQIIAELQHPAIVPVLDFGQHEEQLFLVMPHRPGDSLATRLLQGVLSPQEAGKVLARIAEALDAAHAQRMVHRDLKPSNILFDAKGEAYLADFGIAIQTAGGSGDADVIHGTPAYMSPEQCRPEATVDGRSDIYSLGVTLYEMLTGSVPFKGDTALAIMTQHLYRPPPSLYSANPAVPPVLEPVLYTALAKEPAARYQRARMLSEMYEQKLAQADEVSMMAATASTTAEETTGAGTQIAKGQDEAAPLFVPAPEMEEDVPAAILPADDESVVEGRQRTQARWSWLSDMYQALLKEHFYVALALVSMLGMACAVATVMAMRDPEATPTTALGDSIALSTETGRASPTPGVPLPVIGAETGVATVAVTATVTAAVTGSPNLLLLYSEEIATAINLSGDNLSLANLNFRRPATGSAEAAFFAADEWRSVAGNVVDALPPGDCLQLVRLGVGSSRPQKPEQCGRLRGWLGTRQIGRLFFVPQTDVDAFEVYRGETLVGVCTLAGTECRLQLLGP